MRHCGVLLPCSRWITECGRVSTSPTSSRLRLAELSKRDDAWLMTVDKDWTWGPTHNLCKWSHVCEHEAYHTGQIAFLRCSCAYWYA